jgi:hypothetical protein
MRVQSTPAAARLRGLGSGAECGVVAPAGISAGFRFRSVPSTHSHRFLLHHVKQRSLLHSRGALLSAGSSLPLSLHVRFASFSAPNEGRQSAGGGSLAFPVALARRDALPPVRREGASRRSRWRFPAAGPTLHIPAVPTGIRAATSPPARRSRPADRIRASRGRGSLQASGRHSPAPPSGHLRRRPS